MKAVHYSKYGNPAKVLQVKEIERPVPKADELLVRVYATTVNRTDEGIVTARYVVSRLYSGLLKPIKPIPGTDFSGTVEAVGEAVTQFKTGDKVFGFNDEGLSSHAEYLTIGENKALAIMPKNISYEEAAASLEGFHYAYNFINKVKLQRGQKVLVNGATGAIGSAAIQLLKYYETEITAIADTKNLELVRSLGAIRVIDYTREDFTLEKEKYNFIFDAVGKSSFKKCKPLLTKGGTYISSELGAYGSNLFFALATPLFGAKKVIFPFPVNLKRSILFVKKLIDGGHFKAIIDRIYPLEEAVTAYEYVQEGQKTGNVVLSMNNSPAYINANL